MDWIGDARTGEKCQLIDVREGDGDDGVGAEHLQEKMEIVGKREGHLYGGKWGEAADSERENIGDLKRMILIEVLSILLSSFIVSSLLFFLPCSL